MYRVEKQTHRHRRLVRNLWIVFVVSIFGVALYVLTHLRITPEQNIRNAAPTSKGFDNNSAAKVKVDKPLFTMELPAGWKEVAVTINIVNAPKYAFSSNAERMTHIDLYIDAIPATLGINKAIVLTSQGDGVSYGTVSENCTTFTDLKLSNPKTGLAPAKWQETNFLCDTGNYNRQVVGTIAGEGVNTLTVHGTTQGSHVFFMTYTDNTIGPSYTTLYDILGSLHFK